MGRQLSVMQKAFASSVIYFRESEGICFHRRWFMCLSVSLCRL